MKIEQNRDYAISLIRLIATAFIITCHIMQYFNFVLAWWFNVGVQIFLCMSGFLYGRKGKLENEWTFYKKNTARILIDYYVVVLFVVVLFTALAPEEISVFVIAKMLLTRGVINGGQHLWYIPYCLLCYLVTPFLFRYFDYYKNNIVKAFFILCVLAFVIIEGFFNFFISAWIICYIIGYFFGTISDEENQKLYKVMSVIIIACAILSNSIQIVIDYVLKFKFGGIYALVYERYCNYAHVALGVALFIVLKYAMTKLFKNGYPNLIKKICSCSDKYSYDIYLVHQFVILGPLSLMALTKNLGVNIALVLAVIFASAIVVRWISSGIRKTLKIT